MARVYTVQYRLGGLRRKRQQRPSPAPTPSRGSGSIDAVQRLLEIAVLDTLGLENSVARSRMLIGAAGIAVRLIEAEREAAMGWEVE